MLIAAFLFGALTFLVLCTGVFLICWRLTRRLGWVAVLVELVAGALLLYRRHSSD